MSRKLTKFIFSFSCGFLLFSSYSFGEDKTIIDNTTVQTTSTVDKSKKHRPVKTSVTSTTNTTTISEPQPRKVLDEETLKKISNTLCSEGFKAYVGSDKKNVCSSKVTPPDIAYTCFWDKKGPAAYAPSTQGPCLLDFAEHKGSIILTKEDYPSNPPLSYGTEVQCCYRAAQGPAVVN